MYGDLDVIRRRVGQLREQADEVRLLADRLVARADGIDWHGRAADALRGRMRDRAGDLRESARQHERAADALDRHAAEVGRLREDIAEIESRVGARVSEARGRIERVTAASGAGPDGVRREPSPEDSALAAFVPPPPGHKDWLTIEIGRR